MISNDSTNPRPRLDRAGWLDAALDTLHRDGVAAVKVEPLARRLGVTKGSFYHHFADRDALLDAMVDRWRATQEAHLAALEAAPTSSPRERLERVIAFTHAKDSSHDVGMRAWALQHPAARSALRAIDRGRLDYVESIFRELGWGTDQARLRARLLYHYQIGEATISCRDADATRERLRVLRLELLAGGP